MHQSYPIKSGSRYAQSGRDKVAPRRLFLELLEARHLLASDLLSFGAVYVEEDLGSDAHGDRIEVSFAGGAPGTELTTLTLSGDQNQPGLDVGDVIFDTSDEGLGADHGLPFEVVELVAEDDEARVVASVADGTSLLTLTFENFRAGDKLVFSIDVDEVEFLEPVTSSFTQRNSGLDPITSGIEFQGSVLTATFVAANYEPLTETASFRNFYSVTQVLPLLDLPDDNDGGKRDRSAAALGQSRQQVIPASLSGYVFHDQDNDGRRGMDEQGIAGATVRLIPIATHEPQTVVSLQTDETGYYEFQGIMPGEYRLVESQPEGYLDGREQVGTIHGTLTGTSTSNDAIDQITIAGGEQGIEYNFGELLVGSLAGQVLLSDAEGRCEPTDPAVHGLAAVQLDLFDGLGEWVATTFTDADGRYEFADLPPGLYSIRESTPTGLINGASHVGTVDGLRVGTATADQIEAIRLGSGGIGADYNFCEHSPAEVTGYVYHDQNQSGLRDPDELGIGGVTIGLYDGQGTLLEQTQTDSTGAYRFAGLLAGAYELREMQPAGWLDGQDSAGFVGEASVGVPGNDQIAEVRLGWGQQGREFNFGELLPGSISGTVHADLDGDCVQDADETGIAGVRIELLDSAGDVIRWTETDSAGQYSFDGIAPGLYQIRETQPEGFFQGAARVGGTTGSAASSDLLVDIEVGSDQHLVDYDFCEIPPAQLTGQVVLSSGDDCEVTPESVGIANVTVRLLNAQGAEVATVLTDAMGHYQFQNLQPGNYSVWQDQPDGYFDGGTHVGTGGATSVGINRFDGVHLTAGAWLAEYNFCEIAPGSISGYVFQDGETLVTEDGEPPENLFELRDGVRTPDDTPLPGVRLQLRDGTSGQPISGSVAIAGTYGAGPIETVTNSEGYYQFVGLPPGNYAVYEFQPAGYIDGLDTPGTTSGIAINPVPGFVPPRTLADMPTHDAIILIPLAAGNQSLENNFSEIRIDSEPGTNPPVTPDPPEVRFPDPPPVPASLSIPWRLQPLTGQTGVPPLRRFGAAHVPMTWHLSILDAGQPRRSEASVIASDQLSQLRWLRNDPWSHQLNQGQWEFNPTDHNTVARLEGFYFGRPHAVPIAGDFNGDGRSEIGVFSEGQWFIDLNGNGQWDEGDLWAQLGSEGDHPVCGDWDGDGKDDIGIFGPEWAGDWKAILHEPGLPDSQNTRLSGRPKNVPPTPQQAAQGVRVLKRHATAVPRADLIDHVFHYGDAHDYPVVGDWNGDGIATIGRFSQGTWWLDVDGDGRHSSADLVVVFGHREGYPVVGDFNQDGVDDLGTFDRGAWILDGNGNRIAEDTDLVFRLGEAGDLPVVGDWDGDGKDEPAVFRPQASHLLKAASLPERLQDGQRK